MNQKIQLPPHEIEYPETDGQPMGENTIQAKWIVMLFSGIDNLFETDPNVFVAMDLFWYPLEGNNKIVTAPDVLVAFGRPKGERSSYRQWEEGGVAPQVVIEVLSPSNLEPLMDEKFDFYQQHGVEEYYIYDPETAVLQGFQRKGGRLKPIPRAHRWTSPRLGARFDLSGEELQVIRPDGQRFESYNEIYHSRQEAYLRIEEQRQKADQERQRAEQEQQRAEQERLGRNALAAKLRELGIDPDSIAPGS